MCVAGANILKESKPWLSRHGFAPDLLVFIYRANITGDFRLRLDLALELFLEHGIWTKGLDLIMNDHMTKMGHRLLPNVTECIGWMHDHASVVEYQEIPQTTASNMSVTCYVLLFASLVVVSEQLHNFLKMKYSSRKRMFFKRKVVTSMMRKKPTHEFERRNALLSMNACERHVVI